jgi:glyoxylase-like metal-dependent hydrolase (beta-lactamase superfamily II)
MAQRQAPGALVEGGFSMTQQIAVSAATEVGQAVGGGLMEIDETLAYLRLAIVNVVFFGPRNAGDRGWVLVDAGIPGSRSSIETAAGARFGDSARPAAIILTHGHFDHVGAVEALASNWDAPVYAHRLEHSYLDGTSSYPPADPSIRDGLMSLLSPLYPRGPIDLGARLRALPADHATPEMPGWRWIHTPGHTPGHVSLWHEESGRLIAGDAAITTAQESAYDVARQSPEIHGPPRYFTMDWVAAEQSARKLSALRPKTLVTGHGPALAGPAMRAGLERLAEEFGSIAPP